jgi:hypothetical protein
VPFLEYALIFIKAYTNQWTTCETLSFVPPAKPLSPAVTQVHSQGAKVVRIETCWGVLIVLRVNKYSCVID